MNVHKKKLFNVIYGRTFVILILLFIQVLMLAIMFFKLTDYVIYLYSFFIVMEKPSFLKLERSLYIFSFI